jgi:hypothetical protein
MARQAHRSDSNADRNQGSNPGPRQEGLGGGFWSEEIVSTDWPLRNRVGVYGFRQDVPLKGVHESQ